MSPLHLPLNGIILRLDFKDFFCFRRVLSKNDGKAPLTFKRFQSIVSSLETTPTPVSPVDYSSLGGARTPVGDDHDDQYGVPTLQELGEQLALALSL